MTKICYKEICDILLEDIDVFPSAIKNHILNKKNKEKYIESLAGWSLLRSVIGCEKFNQLDFDFNTCGKPLCNDLYFNLSHSNGVVAVGISEQNIGVDIEYVNPLKEIDDISKKMFGQVFDKEEFYKRFTNYEACVKYIGKSVFNTSDISCELYNKVKWLKLTIGNKNYYLSYLSDEEYVEI